MLTRWGQLAHICVSRLTVTGSDNDLSPGRWQAIIWTNARILLIGPLGTNFSENLIDILAFLFTKMRLKLSSAKWRPFCLGLNVLKDNTATYNPTNFGPSQPELFYVFDKLFYQNGIVTATAYFLKSVMQWPAGWLADYLINARVLSVTNVRKMFMAIGMHNFDCTFNTLTLLFSFWRQFVPGN